MARMRKEIKSLEMIDGRRVKVHLAPGLLIDGKDYLIVDITPNEHNKSSSFMSRDDYYKINDAVRLAVDDVPVVGEQKPGEWWVVTDNRYSDSPRCVVFVGSVSGNLVVYVVGSRGARNIKHFDFIRKVDLG